MVEWVELQTFDYPN